ncbi:MAG TPA: class I SAM-dependent methyltransferase [Candidatus Aquicultor sp.]|jgi:ubiquinone/menaquinone biosynthesis C-methylase UbiE
MVDNIQEQVRLYWEQEPCGSGQSITGNVEPGTLAWFERIEEHRYTAEPMIHAVAQFTRHHGKKVLEIGVGAGTDHLQWARAGAECYGVDLTDAAIQTTRDRLALYGLHSQLQRVDAERLPFDDDTFDIVYSWGVIHHSEKPELIVQEIRRVLKSNGIFIGMMYGRHSVLAFKLWVKYALLKGKPWHSFADVIWHHMESIGTKAHTTRELKEIFSEFGGFSANSVITIYDKNKFPRWVSGFFPDKWGWYITMEAKK